jgi:hypothetical protein
MRSRKISHNLYLAVCLASAIALSSFLGKAEAQTQSSLTNKECISATPGLSIEDILVKPFNVSFVVAKEVFPVTSLISSGTERAEDTWNTLAILSGNQPVELACNLRYSYKELKLVFGVNTANPYATKDNKITFKVYLDGDSKGEKEVVVGRKREWKLNLEGVKNISFKVQCKKDKCPALAFSEMSLK